MKKILILIALVAVALLVFLSAPKRAPLTFASPSGGESWLAGETHKISWKASGAPSSYKVSISIRRIPPPALPEDGQEFDPIIATNLPNTGSYDWKVSGMYPDGDYILTLSAYKSLPVKDPITAESAAFHIAHPALSADLYPLYPAAEWQKPEVMAVSVGDRSFSGASLSSFPISAGFDAGKSITQFEEYYSMKLGSLGWRRDNSLEAGGHVGGQSGYVKGGKAILVGFHIDYESTPPDAPSECPCTVSLSLFSEN